MDQPEAHPVQIRPTAPEQWEAQRPTITRLYITEGLELKDVMDIMKDKYHFSATIKQYKDRIKQWGLVKNIKAHEMEAIVRVQNKRKMENGKDTIFRVRKRPVDPNKIARFIRSHPNFNWWSSKSGTPSVISYCTNEDRGFSKRPAILPPPIVSESLPAETNTNLVVQQQQQATFPAFQLPDGTWNSGETLITELDGDVEWLLACLNSNEIENTDSLVYFDYTHHSQDKHHLPPSSRHSTHEVPSKLLIGAEVEDQEPLPSEFADEGFAKGQHEILEVLDEKNEKFDQQQPSSLSPDGWYACPGCKRRFPEKMEANNHLRTYHHIMPESPLEPRWVDKLPNGYTWLSGTDSLDGDNESEDEDCKSRTSVEDEDTDSEDKDWESRASIEDDNTTLTDFFDLFDILGILPASSLRFACPFYQLDPKKYCLQFDATISPKKKEYRTCVGPGFTTIERLMEHLKRNHRPVQCRRCYLIFDGPDRKACKLQLESHRRLPTPCLRQKRTRMEGVSDLQWMDIKNDDRANNRRKVSRVKRYWHIWDNIFPDLPRPFCPWHGITDSNLRHGSYSLGTGLFPDIFSNMLELKVNEQEILFAAGEEEEMKRRTIELAKKSFDTIARMFLVAEDSGSHTSFQPSFQFGNPSEAASCPSTFLGKHSIPSSGFTSRSRRNRYLSTETPSSTTQSKSNVANHHSLPRSLRTTTSMSPLALDMQQVDQQQSVPDREYIATDSMQDQTSNIYPGPSSNGLLDNNLPSNDGVEEGDKNGIFVTSLDSAALDIIDSTNMDQELNPFTMADGLDFWDLPEWQQVVEMLEA